MYQTVLVMLALLGLGRAPTALAAGITFVEAVRDGDALKDAIAVAVSPDGAHVYVAAAGGATLAAFARDAGTGGLTRVDLEVDGIDGVEGLGGAFALAISPDGEHLYVAGQRDDAVAVFARDPATGTVSFVQAVQQLDPEALTVSPDGAHVYVTSFSSKSIVVYARDPATGSLELNDFVSDGVNGVDGLDGVLGVAVSPDGGNVYAVSFREDAIVTFTRDATSGALGFVEAKKGAAGVLGGFGVVVSADGAHVYAAGAKGDEVVAFARDGASGALTEIDDERDGVDGVDGLANARGIALSADGTLLFVAGEQDGAVAVFERDPITGEIAFVEAEIDQVNGVEGLQFASSCAATPDGRHLYVTGQGPDRVVIFAVGDVVVTTTTSTTTTSTTSTTSTTLLEGCAPEPLAGCRIAGKSSLVLKDLPKNSKDQLTWKWARGPATGVDAFGDPLTTTDYAVCLYDARGLLAVAAAPAARLCAGAPCWSANRDGFRYLDRDRGLDGLTQVKLASERGDDATVLVAGKGPNLPESGLPLELPVVVQLVADNGTCFEASYGVVRRNDEKTFTAAFD